MGEETEIENDPKQKELRKWPRKNKSTKDIKEIDQRPVFCL